MTTMRVLGVGTEKRVDKFIKPGECVRFDVPGGYVTFGWDNSASYLGYGYLKYVPLQAGLMRFRRPRKLDAVSPPESAELSE
jgi:hypothetical protein